MSLMIRKFPARLLILSILSFLGVVLSAYLSHQFYEIRGGSAGFRSFCNFGQALNCDAVAASPYAEIAAGIPLSSFSAGWFLAQLILSVILIVQFAQAEARREWLRALLVMNGFAIVLSAFYFFIMASVLKTYCLLCLFLDAITLASLGIVVSLWRKIPAPASASARKSEGAGSGHWKTAAGICAGSIFVAVVLIRSMEVRGMDVATIREAADSILLSNPVEMGSLDSAPSLGPSNAPITIVEFSDFQCPYCRIGAFTLQSVLNRYPTQVRVVFKNFPLDSSCNPLMKGRGGHTQACNAAKVALCSHLQGKFKAVYESLFEHQASLGMPISSPKLANSSPGGALNEALGKSGELAVEAGVNARELSACAQTAETAARITADIEDGKRVGVGSTPTFLINGYKVEGAYPLPVWVEVIDRLLKK